MKRKFINFQSLNSSLMLDIYLIYALSALQNLYTRIQLDILIHYRIFKVKTQIF